MLKYLTAYVPDGFTTNAVRYPLGSVIYLPLLYAAARRKRLGAIWLTALLPTSVNLLAQTLWAIAPYHLDVGVVAFLVRLCVVWGILAAFCLFPDERRLARLPRFWAGVALAIAGFLVMAFDAGVLSSRVGLVGIVIMFFCSIGYGLYGVMVRYVMRDMNPLVVFSVVGGYTSIGVLLLAPLGEPSSLVRLDGTRLAILGLSALIGISTAHVLYYIAVQRIGVAISSLTLSVTPFLSTIIAVVFLGEQFSRGARIGGILLTAGAVLALRSQQHLAAAPEGGVPVSPIPLRGPARGATGTVGRGAGPEAESAPSRG